MFSKLIIIGVGCLGSSIGLAVKKNQLADEVIGIDASDDALIEAKKIGAIDIALRSVSEVPVISLPTLFIVCVPVGDIPHLVAQISETFPESVESIAITDVGSTKRIICDTIFETLSEKRFIGSHPIAGSEQTGPHAAKSDLLTGRKVIVTPSENSSMLQKITAFWQSLGCEVIAMSAEVHDKILAVTSHLPHLVSSAISKTIEDDERNYTGSGFESMTRLAAASPVMWRDICLSNRDAILDAIDRFFDSLAEIRAAIESSDSTRITDFLRDCRDNH